MYITKEDFYLLNDICYYIGNLKGEQAQEFYPQLSNLLSKLNDLQDKKREFNKKRIIEKRRTDKNYAQIKK